MTVVTVVTEVTVVTVVTVVTIVTVVTKVTEKLFLIKFFFWQKTISQKKCLPKKITPIFCY